MDAIVAHYLASRGPATQDSSRSFEQANGRDYRHYVIEKVRSMDSGMLLHEVNGVETRMTIFSEVMRLVRQTQAQAAPTSEMEVDGEIPSDINKPDLAPEYYDSD
jgi:hypothetical protein